MSNVTVLVFYISDKSENVEGDFLESREVKASLFTTGGEKKEWWIFRLQVNFKYMFQPQALLVQLNLWGYLPF